LRRGGESKNKLKVKIEDLHRDKEGKGKGHECNDFRRKAASEDEK